MENSDLFRKEVITEKQNRLHGEVMLKQPLSSRVMVFVLVLCIGVVALWVITGEYARTEQVRGILVTSEPSSKVFAQLPGMVAELEVQEGTLVERGQRLAVIHTDLADKLGQDTAAAGLNSVDNRLALSDQQASVARDRAVSERSRLNMQSASLQRRIGDTKTQIEIQRDIVTSNEKLFDQVEQLVESGFVSGVDYEQRRQNMLSARQGMSRLRQDLEQLRSEYARAQTELGQVGLGVAAQLVEIQSNVEALEQQKTQFAGQQGFTIDAPITGRVTAVQTAEGRRVNGERPMMVIVPDGVELRATIYAPTRAIGFVEPGQEVRLLFDAFPYQRFGSYDGEIREISRIIIDPREADVPFQIEEPVYRVSVALGEQSVEAFGQQVPLQPGMTLTANIVLEEQSFLDWLLTPLRAVLNRN